MRSRFSESLEECQSQIGSWPYRHAKREAEVQTLFQLTHLQFFVLKAGADPPDTSEGKFTSPVSTNTKLAFNFISLVIVDPPFHSRCEFACDSHRSRMSDLSLLSKEGQFSELALLIS